MTLLKWRSKNKGLNKKAKVNQQRRFSQKAESNSIPFFLGLLASTCLKHVYEKEVQILKLKTKKGE